MAGQPEPQVTEQDDDVELTQAEISEAVRGTEQELLQQAFQDETKDDKTEEPESEPQDEPSERADEAPPIEDKGDTQRRDPQGRFVAKDRQQDDERQRADDGDPVPRWRTREIAEERRAAIAERDALRAELVRLQATQQQPPQQQSQAAAQQQQIDPLIDPQGWQRQIEGGFAERLRQMELNFDLRVAHMQHGKAFEQAYEALLQEGQRGNGQLIRQLVSSPAGAGDRIVGWHRNRELLAATGGDLQKFKQQMRAELLQDPEFRKEMMAGMRNDASGRGNQPGRPNTVTQLPPSLSRVAGSSPRVGDPDDGDNSDEAVFQFAMR
jgi:hypothetical protein